MFRTITLICFIGMTLPAMAQKHGKKHHHNHNKKEGSASHPHKSATGKHSGDMQQPTASVPQEASFHADLKKRKKVVITPAPPPPPGPDPIPRRRDP